MEERRKGYADIHKDLRDIKILLMGNGKVGVAEMARRSFEHYQGQKKSTNGLIDWVFRIVISLILGFIALKVGLK